MIFPGFFNSINLEERDKPSEPIFLNKNYIVSNLASDKENINLNINIPSNKKWTIAAFCKGLSEIYKNPYLKEKFEQLEETNSKLTIQIKSLENQITELKEKYYNIEKRNFYFQTSSEESSFNLEGDSSEADSD